MNWPSILNLVCSMPTLNFCNLFWPQNPYLVRLLMTALFLVLMCVKGIRRIILYREHYLVVPIFQQISWHSEVVIWCMSVILLLSSHKSSNDAIHMCTYDLLAHYSLFFEAYIQLSIHRIEWSLDWKIHSRRV